MHIFFALGANPDCLDHGENVHVSVDEVLVFLFANLERKRVGRITSGTSALVVVSGVLSCLCLTPVLCFRAARRSVMMFCCVFVASRKVCALFFIAGFLLGTFQAAFSVFFRVLEQFVGLRGACFALFLHRGPARAHVCASWRRQTTNSEANGVTKLIFPFSRRSFFGQLFVTFRYFSELCDFVKIEFP